MKKFVLACAAAAAALTMYACKSAAPDTHDADVKAIQDLEAQWNQDYVGKDAARIASYYADDAVLITPGAPAFVGKDAIQKGLAQFLSDPGMTLRFHPSRVEVAKSGDIGYTEGSYTMTMTDPQTKQVMNDHGNYVTDYRKQPDGSWKAVADIACSEVPPPVPPRAAVKKH
jgi:uncharacterized protein (TIGR02246 family)